MTWNGLNKEVTALWARWIRDGMSLSDFRSFCEELGTLEAALEKTPDPGEPVPPKLTRRLAQLKDWACQKNGTRFGRIRYSD
ncbi:MAG: hypothetical protein KGJ93_04150 [Patescibacteria group bacterium]|nr:hypothetical protein [Patescibacteria group bacterium]